MREQGYSLRKLSAYFGIHRDTLLRWDRKARQPVERKVGAPVERKVGAPADLLSPGSESPGLPIAPSVNWP